MGRSPCCEKAHTNKGAWTKEEDDRLVSYLRSHGEGCWRSLPKAAGLSRCGKSCRLRWINYLRPDLKRGNFTTHEDQLIINLHTLLGNKWSLIAGRLPGRTDNEIKNYWNTHIRRKLLNQGIDPVTHRPFNQPAASSDQTKNISFSSESYQQQAADNKIINSSSTSSSTIFKATTTTSTILSNHSEPVQNPSDDQEGSCLHLNLDLRISQPYQQYHQLSYEPLTLAESTTGQRIRNIHPSACSSTTICFSCSFGIQKITDHEECSCKSIISTSSSSIDYYNVGYDFLGLKSGILDYRRLEMK